MAWMVHMIGSALSLWNVTQLPPDHSFRLVVSGLTIAAGLLQGIWLMIGSFELAYDRQVKRSIATWTLAVALIVSAILVMAFAFDPEAGAMRVFLRVGIRSLFVGSVFISCGILLLRFLKAGIGIKLILFSFLFYGLQQLNYFGASFSFLMGHDYPFSLPFYMGSFDLALQALMGLGMIINMLELERRNLKKANQELDTFLYRSSHDLRAPLTTILGVVDILKRERVAPEETAKYVDYIHDRAQKADDVIRDIIMLRRGQKMELSVLDINVHALVSELFTRYEALWKGKMQFVLTGDSPLSIRSDVDRLTLALDNIITNSITYRNHDQKDAWVKVHLEKTPTGARITIQDNGQGIAEKHLDKIFDMFYRANMQSEGSGLGLYMVREALDDIQSTIDVQSKEGEGSTFILEVKDLG